MKRSRRVMARRSASTASRGHYAAPWCGTVTRRADVEPTVRSWTAAVAGRPAGRDRGVRSDGAARRAPGAARASEARWRTCPRIQRAERRRPTAAPSSSSGSALRAYANTSHTRSRSRRSSSSTAKTLDLEPVASASCSSAPCPRRLASPDLSCSDLARRVAGPSPCPLRLRSLVHGRSGLPSSLAMPLPTMRPWCILLSCRGDCPVHPPRTTRPGARTPRGLQEPGHSGGGTRCRP